MKALITGATSGIGLACAETLAQLGYSLVLTGRRAERLAKIKLELIQKYGVEVATLSFDISNKNEVQQYISPLIDIDVLINNAGLAAGFGELVNGDIEDWERMIDTNIKGVLYVTKIIANTMKQRGSGHIVNIGSTAAKDVYPNGNVYCATKHALDAISKALRIELLPYHIKVTAVHPGMVHTEFSQVRYKGDNELADKVYDNIDPLQAKDVAEVIGFVLQRPSYVNLNDIVMTCTAQANSMYVHRKQ